jgi:hypothetical protein
MCKNQYNIFMLFCNHLKNCARLISDFNRRGIKVDRNFAGCIRNFEIRRDKDDYKAQYLSSGDITGDVALNKCPLY